ncbi:MAG: ABC transporter ATP-binding protein [Carboxydocellales bacterium]
MGNAKIVIQGVEKSFQNKDGTWQEVLSSVDLEIREGEFVCLLGPSGCGKTTLLNMAAGFDQPSGGNILIDGEQVTGPDPKHLTLFQSYGLFPWRTVLGNVEYGLEVQGVPRRKRQEIAREYISLVGLEKFESHHPNELSGGMQQRVAIARALAVDPEIIFMDEPFGALDAMTRYKMQEEISRIWQEKHKTIVFVTHDIDEAVYLADRIVLMSPHPGRVKRVLEVPIGRPRVRTGYDFTTIRDKVFQEFELVHRQELEFQI